MHSDGDGEGPSLIRKTRRLNTNEAHARPRTHRRRGLIRDQETERETEQETERERDNRVGGGDQPPRVERASASERDGESPWQHPSDLATRNAETNASAERESRRAAAALPPPPLPSCG